MPLQKRKKKKKPASDKSVKQVVTQVVKVNIGDTKAKKRRKRKSSGGVAPSAAPPPMLAQVPQQFIYSPPPPMPQEAPMAPPRQSAPSVEVANPFPVSALNRVLESMPRSTIAVPQEVSRPSLIRPEKPELVMPSQPVMVPAKIKPSPRPPPIGEIRNVEVVDVKPFVAKPKLTGVDRVPIGARDIPESASVPKPRAPTIMRAEQKDTLVSAPSVLQPPDIEEAASVAVDPKRLTEEQMAQRERQRLATAAFRARAKGDPAAPPKKSPGRKKKVVQQGEAGF
jgi:hypothetical protein